MMHSTFYSRVTAGILIARCRSTPTKFEVHIGILGAPRPSASHASAQVGLASKLYAVPAQKRLGLLASDSVDYIPCFRSRGRCYFCSTTENHVALQRGSSGSLGFHIHLHSGYSDHSLHLQRKKMARKFSEPSTGFSLAGMHIWQLLHHG